MYNKLAFANFQHRPTRAVMGAVLIAAGLTAILLAAGLGDAPAPADADSTLRNIASLRPLFRRFAPTFLIACAAITFVATWAKVDTRTYEIAVLRFLGASRLLVTAIVCTEATLLSLAGALAALVISHGLLSWITAATGAVPAFSVSLNWCLVGPSVMVGAAAVGSAIPCAVAFENDVRATLERDR